MKKRKNAKIEDKIFLDMQRNEINNFENEAKNYEKIEAELLQALKQTR